MKFVATVTIFHKRNDALSRTTLTKIPETVIQSGTLFDPQQLGIDDEEIKRLVQRGHIRPEQTPEEIDAARRAADAISETGQRRPMITLAGVTKNPSVIEAKEDMSPAKILDVANLPKLQGEA